MVMAVISSSSDTSPSSHSFLQTIPTSRLFLVSLAFFVLYLVFKYGAQRTADLMISKPNGPERATTMPSKTDDVPGTKPGDPTAEFSGTVKVSQKAPSKSHIAKIGDLPLLNSQGQTFTFKSLHSDPSNPHKRVLVIFVRHFFCGNCQEYLRTLCAAVTPEALSAVSPTTEIVVIGCGSPELIEFYREATACHFPLYCDPTRKLYEELDMIRTKNLSKRPEYQQRSIFSISLESIYQGLSSGRKAFKGGDFWQVGGEFLIENGEVLWCHRMASTRDHTEIPELRRVLGLDEGATPFRKRSTFSNSGIRRSLSMRASSWRSRSRSTGPDKTLDDSKVAEPRDSGVEVEGNTA